MALTCFMLPGSPLLDHWSGLVTILKNSVQSYFSHTFLQTVAALQPPASAYLRGLTPVLCIHHYLSIRLPSRPEATEDRLWPPPQYLAQCQGTQICPLNGWRSKALGRNHIQIGWEWEMILQSLPNNFWEQRQLAFIINGLLKAFFFNIFIGA